MAQILIVATLVAYAFSVYGWGSLVVRQGFGEQEPGRLPALTVALGLIALIFIGGLLNLARVAYPVTFDILLVLGWLFVAADIYLARRRVERRDDAETAINPLIVGLLAIVLIFAAVTLLPSRTINIFDDFFLYLVSPVRALQTGTLAGNPFESGGATTLGAQSFLQSFIVAHYDLHYLPAFDNVFCLVLTAALAAELARIAKLSPLLQIICIACAVAFNPEIVNTTSVYSASALILALVVTMHLANRIDEPAKRGRAMIVVGLTAGAVVCLKNTYFIHAGLMLISFFLATAYAESKWSRIWSDVRFTILGGALIILPWMAIYVGDYDILWKLHNLRGVITPGNLNNTLHEPPLTALFTGELAFFGGYLFQQTIAFAAIAICGGLAVRRIRSATGPDRSLAAGMIGQAIGFFASFLIVAQMAELNITLRYVAPIALASIVIAIIYIGRLVQRYAFATALSVLLPLGVVALFVGNFVERLDWAMHKHSQLAFESGRDAPYLPYLDAAMTHNYDSWIKGIQDRIPADAGILTWHPYSFLMDFRRNRIYTLNDGSHHNPLFAFPVAGDFQRTTDVLRDIGISYIVWEHTGLQHITQTVQNWPELTKSRYALARTQAQSMMRMNDYMQYLMRRETPSYTDGRIIIFDIGTPTSP